MAVTALIDVLLMPLIEHKLFSFVLAFSKPHEGGALEIFDLQPTQQGQRIAAGDRSVFKPDLDALERVSVRLDPGDMIIFNSGHYLHRVTPVVGPVVRWTACSFMAEAKGTRFTPLQPSRSNSFARFCTALVMSVSAGPPFVGLYLKPPSSGGLCDGVMTMPSAR